MKAELEQMMAEVKKGRDPSRASEKRRESLFGCHAALFAGLACFAKEGRALPVAKKG